MATKAGQPVLMGFLSSRLANGSDQEEELFYDQNLQVNVNEVGEVAWAMAKSPTPIATPRVV